jgi:predicted nucleic acid-binding protein
VIVVDSSVWISHFSNVLHPEVDLLRRFREVETILVGDLILLELLRGARSDRLVRIIEAELAEFDLVSMVDGDIVRQAAANYRRLRASGITIRNSIDLLVGTYCIVHGHELLHRDRDFDHLRLHLGLKVLH